MEKFLSKFPSQYFSYFNLKPKFSFKPSNHKKSHRPEISIMSWNILASGYTCPNVYYYVNPDYLTEDHRMNMITYDLLKNDCDIICLQEIERRNHEKFQNDYLTEYEGIFQKRSGLTCDGLSIFFKNQKYKKSDYFVVDFNKITVLSDSQLKFVKNYQKTNNLAQVLILEPINNSSFDFLVIVNLHLYWDPNKEIIKYLQAAEINLKLNEILSMINIEKAITPLIVCGDFNSLPDSNVFDLLNNRFIPEKVINEDRILYDYVFKKTKDLKLTDSHINNLHYETNIKTDFSGKIDYIFYSREHLQHPDVAFIDTNSFKEEKGLPNSFHGSDHIYLISKFYI